ncbi:uncharacterized protein PV06_02862 [Exophiala oligosperma]|uniref:Arrestin-like N-terminal domain-containing protein n=1 Tax=Exophiala oligosperma TaxID=215243 RepID=A0A0D2B4U6_9EURO|nr:uncharacterized protein PV06_02862 [Exophiala oligosperma]KIW47281.1 hypothetical protein PV06_02862 [Exophiala oligosperma]
MTFRIVLSGNERGYFCPGDHLNGVVTLAAPREGHAESVSMSFFGRSVVLIARAGRKRASSCGYLCRKHIILLRGLHFYAGQTFFWPFTFQLPRHSTFLYRDETNTTNVDGVFSCESPWRGSSDAETIPLPPSFSYKGKFNCHVEYVIQARLIQPPSSHLLSGMDMTAYTEITVRPPLPTIAFSPVSTLPRFQSHHQTFFCSSSHRAHRMRSLTPELFGTSNGGLVSSLPLNNLYLSIHILLPNFINLQAQTPVPVAVRATHSSKDGSHFGIQIRSLRLDLVSHTKVRARSVRASECRRICLIEEICNIPVHQADPLELQNYDGKTKFHGNDEYFRFVTERGLEITYLDKCATSTILDRTNLVPEFCTYNIFQSYSLDVKCQMNYGKERLTCTENGIPIQLVNFESDTPSTLLSREDRSQVTDFGNNTHENNMSSDNDDMSLSETIILESPPAYRASVSPQEIGST